MSLPGPISALCEKLLLGHRRGRASSVWLRRGCVHVRLMQPWAHVAEQIRPPPTCVHCLANTLMAALFHFFRPLSHDMQARSRAAARGPGKAHRLCGRSFPAILQPPPATQVVPSAW